VSAHAKAAASDSPDRKPGRAILLAHGLSLAAAAAVIALTWGTDRWSPLPLAVIATFTVVSAVTYVSTGSAHLQVSGSFLGLMIAAVLLGGGPAALVGALAVAATWVRLRAAMHYLRNNIITYLWFPLVGGLFFHAVVHVTHLHQRAVGYYLVVFAAFVLALVVNFLGIAGYQCYLERSSLLRKVVEAFVPLLAAELFSAILTMAAVYVAVQTGIVGIALFGVVLVVFQYLVGELLKSKHRGDELQRMATTDELTGLPNRERLRERVQALIYACEHSDQAFAVMLMDLDRFKEINDTLGHHYGDALLRELGPRLAGCVAPDGLVARLGGDEFAILPDVVTGDPDALEQIAGRLMASIHRPVVVDELSIEVSASIGIARFPVDGRDVHTLMRCADVAMYAAKEAQSGWTIYASEHDRHSRRRLSVLTNVRRALEADQIVVHFQPIVALPELEVRGAEALARWEHPELGLLGAGSFIPPVEQTALIRPLTYHMLERSIAQCAAWRRSGQDLSIAVNLSIRNLLDRNLPQDVEGMLNSHGLAPEALQLEITERMIMADPERVMAIVMRLCELGIRLAVDDFGTGYSSLANLRRLPIDELKIDRSFVSPMLGDESDLIIVRSTINLGHDLGLRVIAEGVEDAATLERLALLGCDLVQGFHLSRPMSPEAFTAWLSHPDQLLAA
jgi:diguanylate cyclase (GGDEF)-like protein